jgi:hypothetical protein
MDVKRKLEAAGLREMRITACNARQVLLELALDITRLLKGFSVREKKWSCSFCLPVLLAFSVTHTGNGAATSTPSAIPWCQIGAKAGADYQGDGLAVMPTDFGARLRCVFQRLDGEATTQGLWLTSTVTNAVNDRFRVVATSVGRLGSVGAPERESEAGDSARGSISLSKTERRHGVDYSTRAERVGRRQALVVEGTALKSESANAQAIATEHQLEGEGDVSASGQTLRFNRPGLTEEYSLSMDGVRQDFIVEESPPCPPAGDLVVRLSVTGARVEATPYGAALVLENSGRKIAYSRLRVTDARGKELKARIEVCPADGEGTSFESREANNSIEEVSLLTSAATKNTITVVVEDAAAVYPVRIDPTFSDANWVSLGGIPGAAQGGGVFGPNGIVYAAVVDASGNLYIGGSFGVAGNIRATNIAKWNGGNWSALGAGISGASGPFNPSGVYVAAIAVLGDTVYAGGNFTLAGGAAANYIAQWNGTNWSAMGSGMNNSVQTLAVLGSTLYAGGQFTTANGSGPPYIARWNGNNWSGVGSGMNNYVEALAVSGSTLYAGGDFTSAGGASANYVARWNGSSWSPLGSGMNAAVLALAASGNMLYAGGHFTNAGGIAASGVAQWDGSAWSALGSGIPGGFEGVYALAASGTTLYAGGLFTTAGTNAASYVAQWDGTTWSTVGTGMNSIVQALAVSGGTLYAAGSFTKAGNAGAIFVAQWNGSDWSALGTGLNSFVKALALSGNTLYVGGNFTTAASGAANYIAQWDGSDWSALGSGMDSQVLALATSGNLLYAGGDFINAGGSQVNHIAQWDGTRWSSLGSGMSGNVGALAMGGNTLYAGGTFTNAGGTTVNNVAQWDGFNWSAVGAGINGGVDSLLIAGGTLYAGGSGVARWDGSNWSALGSGPGSGVETLAMLGGTLYAGGIFSSPLLTSPNYIASWDGTNWGFVGSGLNNAVSALVAASNVLYAGGNFTASGTNGLGFIAQWNGTNWSGLGTGMNNNVFSLAISGDTLFAGGYFTTAGANASGYLAEAFLEGFPVAILVHNTAFGVTNGAFGFDISGPPGSNLVIQASTDLQAWIPLQTNTLGGNGLFYFSDPQSSANGRRFYRAVEQ